MRIGAVLTIFTALVASLTALACQPPAPAPGPLLDHNEDQSPAPGTGRAPAMSPSVEHHWTGQAPAQNQNVFDVADFGAVDDGKTDSTSAFLSAWEEACSHSGESTFLIPAGVFFVDQMTFTGPCWNRESPKVDIRGTLRAPSRLSSSKTSNWIVFEDLHRINVTGNIETAILDGNGEEAWEESCRKDSNCDGIPTSLRFVNVSGGTINNIALVNSKGFHMAFYRSHDIQVHNINITAPEDSPNTDGIHISHSEKISILSSKIGVGDDCVSIGPGSINITVSDIECGPGHGISVGSLGKYEDEEDVTMITVRNCKISGTENGVRVKTWPGSSPSNASNMVFQDILMHNVSNPIILDQEYCPSDSCKTREPSQVKISNLLFKNISGTFTTEYSVSLLCSPMVTCENVLLSGIDLNTTSEEADRTGRLNIKGSIEGLRIFDSHF